MYTDIVIDISHEQLDRPFQYRIPDALKDEVHPGIWVWVPFGRGNTRRKGFVLKLSDSPSIAEDKIKDIEDIVRDGVSADNTLTKLAVWIYENYGGNLIQSLKTVMPVKKQVRHEEISWICRCDDSKVFDEYLEKARKKNWRGRVRLLEGLQRRNQISSVFARQQLMVTSAILRPLVNDGIIKINKEISYRGNVTIAETADIRPTLNNEQRFIVDDLLKNFEASEKKPALIYGITGSGKTEVYMNLIEGVLNKGRQVIVLIPEISLTYQVIMNFYSRFGDVVSMINSRLSDGEKYDQFERAKNGLVSIMVGPRSALFTPFKNLGLIIMDEEQESAYISEQIPRYHTRETAQKLAELTGAQFVMGSATPSLEAFTSAENGEYSLYTLSERAVKGSSLANVAVADMRAELEEGNRSIFSNVLREMMEDRLRRHEQIMLFINRRGYSRAVSCRSCGKPIECPHCAVALTEHLGGKLMCHYCGYTSMMPKKCPHCGSVYIGGFGMGTQKVEMIVSKQFPQAGILRMDMDTTSGKGDHEKILESFRNHEADILIGTQMIVKGHDFPDVTLVGILAADMSLYSSDFRSCEKTFQLITQAAGRAGRGQRPGDVVIQTYDPENYSIAAAAMQDYRNFYDQEMRYRRMMSYPPCGKMCEVICTSADRDRAANWIHKAGMLINEQYHDIIKIIGPSDAPVSKIRDMWRMHLFMRTGNSSAFFAAIALISENAEAAKSEKVYITVNIL